MGTKGRKRMMHHRCETAKRTARCFTTADFDVHHPRHLPSAAGKACNTYCNKTPQPCASHYLHSSSQGAVAAPHLVRPAPLVLLLMCVRRQQPLESKHMHSSNHNTAAPHLVRPAPLVLLLLRVRCQLPFESKHTHSSNHNTAAPHLVRPAPLVLFFLRVRRQQLPQALQAVRLAPHLKQHLQHGKQHTKCKIACSLTFRPLCALAWRHPCAAGTPCTRLTTSINH